MSNTAARVAAPRLRHTTHVGKTAAAPRRRAVPVLQPAPKAIPKPAPKTRPHLTIVDREALRHRRRVRAAFVLASGVMVTLLLIGVSLHVKLAESQFQLDRLNAQVSTEQQRYETLRLHVAELSSPDRIVSTAKEKLGMVQPGQTTFLTAQLPPAARGVKGEVTSSSADANDATAATLSKSWPKVKENLAVRP